MRGDNCLGLSLVVLQLKMMAAVGFKRDSLQLYSVPTLQKMGMVSEFYQMFL